MKSHPNYLLLLALLLLGGILSIYFSTGADQEPPQRDAVGSDRGLPSELLFDLPQVETDLSSAEIPEFPPGTVSGEWVLHFTNREEYQAYLAALLAAGHKPLGQIDALLAVRIPDQALLGVDLAPYGGRASYSYRVQQPLPPVEIDPEALASMQAYGVSARSIVGGNLQGDGSGVKVAILDSGIHAHPQFDQIRMQRIDLVGDGVAASGAAHGTSVASIIAGREGVAPNADLLVVRVLDDQGLGNSYHVAEGIIQAVDLGARVINLSLGVYEDSLLLRQAVNYASEKGVLMVAAPGNDGYARMAYPAAYPEVLAVTAVDGRGNHAVFANQAEDIDFAAPGIGILTAKEDEGTTLFSGTSAATPFVSGTLASLMSGDAAMPAQEAVQLLKGYLNDAGAPGIDPLYGAGVLDWVRIREREVPDILDVALAGIHLDSSALPGTNMPIDVTVQNRGTKWFNQAELEVQVNDADPQRFTVGTLGPGQITTRKVYAQVPSSGSEEGLSVVARILPEAIYSDVRLENNLRAVQYKPR